MLDKPRRRQEEVLAIIINKYIETAQPVGSRFVARKLALSSATIRNVMSDLEEIGLITQPYTSAGRIPTDKGYRYYIDSLMRVRRISENIIRSIEEQYHEALESIEDVLEKTSHLVSTLTSYVGVTLFPSSDRLYLDGTSHIVEQPEFKDLNKLYSLLKCLEQKTDILDLLSNDIDEKLTVHIGRENRSNFLNECSIVTRGYRMKGRPAGKVGVIGPKRMAYEKVIPTVEFLADKISRLFDEFEI